MLIENVIVALEWTLGHDSALLQQVLLYHRPLHQSIFAVVDLDEFAEPAGVIIVCGLCVTKCLQHRSSA